MAAKEAHGVVVVRVSSGTIHRGETGHTEDLFKGTDEWELFPNVVLAVEAGYKLCQGCYYPPQQPRWVTGT